MTKGVHYITPMPLRTDTLTTPLISNGIKDMKSIKGLGLPQSTAVPVSWMSELPSSITLVLYAFWEWHWLLGHSIFACVTSVLSLPAAHVHC